MRDAAKRRGMGPGYPAGGEHPSEGAGGWIASTHETAAGGSAAAIRRPVHPGGLGRVRVEFVGVHHANAVVLPAIVRALGGSYDRNEDGSFRVACGYGDAMKVAYVDMIGGAAGDMLLGAWVDAGLDVRELERALRSVVADGWELVVERVDRAGISATHLDLVIPGEDHHAHGPGEVHHHEHAQPEHRLRDILAIVERSGLSARQIERASAIYRRLADAEARLHGQPVEDMVFHQVGQVDAILDVAGTCIALDLFDIDAVRCSAFPFGHGLARGLYPNPSPVSLDLVRGFPVRAVDVESELVSMTGAAILTTLVQPGPAIDMTLERVGYGAGRKQFDIPNVVRVMIGERTEPAARTSA